MISDIEKEKSKAVLRQLMVAIDELNKKICEEINNVPPPVVNSMIEVLEVVSKLEMES